MPTLTATARLYAEYVNPQWVRLLDALRMNVPYIRCEGAELFRADGQRVLDFLSGYCVHNVGHNHPYVVSALREELDRSGPVMLQSNVPDLRANLLTGFARPLEDGYRRPISPVPEAKEWRQRSNLLAPTPGVPA